MIKIQPTPEHEGNSCYVCPPNIDLETKTSIRPPGLAQVFLTADDPNAIITHVLELCPAHLLQFAEAAITHLATIGYPRHTRYRITGQRVRPVHG